MDRNSRVTNQGEKDDQDIPPLNRPSDDVSNRDRDAERKKQDAGFTGGKDQHQPPKDGGNSGMSQR